MKPLSGLRMAGLIINAVCSFAVAAAKEFADPASRDYSAAENIDARNWTL
jgi:hypothetical protein